MSQNAGPRAAVARRSFLGTLGGATTAAVAATQVPLDSIPAEAREPEAPPGDRIAEAYAVRIQAADRMAPFVKSPHAVSASRRSRSSSGYPRTRTATARARSRWGRASSRLTSPRAIS